MLCLNSLFKLDGHVWERIANCGFAKFVTIVHDCAISYSYWRIVNNCAKPQFAICPSDTFLPKLYFNRNLSKITWNINTNQFSFRYSRGKASDMKQFRQRLPSFHLFIQFRLFLLTNFSKIRFFRTCFIFFHFFYFTHYFIYYHFLTFLDSIRIVFTILYIKLMKNFVFEIFHTKIPPCIVYCCVVLRLYVNQFFTAKFVNWWEIYCDSTWKRAFNALWQKTRVKYSHWCDCGFAWSGSKQWITIIITGAQAC